MSHLRLHRILVVLVFAATLLGHVRDAAARHLRIKRVALAGVHTAPRAALRRSVAPLLTAGKLSASQRRGVAVRVQRRLLRTLRGLGYFRAAVRVTEYQPGAHTSFVVLRARITEGKRHRIGALDVSGVGPQLRLKGLAVVRLRSGQFFDAGDLRRSSDAVATVLADRGHAFVRVSIKRTRHKRQPLIDLTFHVRPGPVVKVGKIVVRGASATGTRLVRRALLLRRGSRYHRTTLRRALARLRRTGAFKSLKLTETALGKKRIQITVTVVRVTAGR